MTKLDYNTIFKPVFLECSLKRVQLSQSIQRNGLFIYREMAKRKAISKKTRFEVFKRDKFKCQYCGKSAPEIVLHLDHIVPVASGGDDNLMNLITSCKDCNLGKSFRELTNDSVLIKQKKQLEDLQERREQLELLAKWRKELLQIDNESVELIVREIENAYENHYSVNENGRLDIKKWLKKFPLNEIIECIGLSMKYLELNEKNRYTKESVNLFFNKISRIAYVRNIAKKDPIRGDTMYIKNIVGKKYGYELNSWRMINIGNRIEKLLRTGKHKKEDILEIANSNSSIKYFVEDIYSEV